MNVNISQQFEIIPRIKNHANAIAQSNKAKKSKPKNNGLCAELAALGGDA
ncbi:MAG: hypothetical protein J7647_06285 [Cyanobacteria bacterium SBLK]|nr:hypothetical protein [Cyanobacteria bacterium SBLK]